MKRMCSWCNKEITSGAKANFRTDQIITHGICEACAASVLADLETFEFLPEPKTLTLARKNCCTGKESQAPGAGSAQRFKTP